MVFTQSASVERYHTVVDSSGTIDVFGDGSCIDLFTLNSTLKSENNRSFSVISGSASFGDGVFGKAYHGDTSTEVKLSDGVFPSGLRTSCSLSFWMKPDLTIDDKTGLFYNFSDWGGICISIHGGSLKIKVFGTGIRYEMTGAEQRWYFVTIVWDTVSDLCSIFLDGSEVIQVQWTSDREYHNSYNGFWLNGIAEYGSFLSGFSSDQIRFFNRPLTADEISKLYAERVADGLITQSASVGAYSVPKMAQSASVESYIVDTLSQSQSVGAYAVDILPQSQNIQNYEEETFTQSASIATQYASQWFQQMQRVHEYQPYIDKKDICDIFEGSPAAYRFAAFEDTLDSDCYSGTLTAHGAGALFTDGGKWGRAFRLDGQRWLSDTITLDTEFTVAFWFETASIGTDCGYGEVLYFDSEDLSIDIYFGCEEQTFFIDAYSENDSVEYISHKYAYQNEPVQVIINVQDGRMRIYLNSERVIDGVFEITSPSNGTMLIGTSDIDGDDILQDGRFDQLRIFNAALTGSQLVALLYDSVASMPFRQSASMRPFTVERFRQSLSVADYTVEKFRQSNYLFGKNASIFRQSQRIEMGWKNITVFRQSQRIEPDPGTARGIIIERETA